MGAPAQIKSHRDLIVWRKAMDFVESVYAATTRFPREETYALTSQIRRAVVSVPSNIAEGQGRRLAKEYLYFPANARGLSHGGRYATRNRSSPPLHTGRQIHRTEKSTRRNSADVEWPNAVR